MKIYTRSILIIPLMVVACGLCSCSTDIPHADKITGSVKLKVTYDGKPVPKARVNLGHPTTGAGPIFELDEAGTATMDRVEVGDYVVTVLPPMPENVFAEPGQPAPKMEVRKDIPEKFRLASSSTLKATVVEGENDFAFDLNVDEKE